MTDSVDIEPITWDHVDFRSRHAERVEGDGHYIEVPPAVTNLEAQEIAEQHFPEGPAAALESQQAWVSYQASVAAEKAALPATTLFFRSKQPLPEAAKRWDGFVKDWAGHYIDCWMAGRNLAHIKFEAGINLTPPLQQEAARSSWRDRRPKQEKGRDTRRGRGKGER